MPTIYWVPILGLILIVAFEIYAAFSHRRETGKLMTISQMFWWVSGRSLRNALVFGFGFLCGHLFT